MTAAVFKACYAEWRVIKTRATVQLVFEIPIERADEAYQVLGGMPIAAHEIWCGIARLGSELPQRAPPAAVEAAPRPAPTLSNAPAGTDEKRRPFNTLPYSTQAGIRCGEPVFRMFLRVMCGVSTSNSDEAADFVRAHCDVNSRADIKPGTEAESAWLELERWFDAWKTRERVA